MVFGGIFGLLVKCTFVDFIGFEFCSRRRKQLMRAQAAILCISLCLNVTALAASLQESTGVINTMPLVRLIQIKDWFLNPAGVKTPFPEGSEHDP